MPMSGSPVSASVTLPAILPVTPAKRKESESEMIIAIVKMNR
jgi:hypothetical protein